MKPLPPSSLCVTYLGTESVVIAWTKPYSDGDAPVLHYVLEKRDSGKSTWDHLTNLPPDVTECELDNMATDKVYYMRVRAANRFGLSDPRDLDQPVTIKADKRGEIPNNICFDLLCLNIFCFSRFCCRSVNRNSYMSFAVFNHPQYFVSSPDHRTRCKRH